MSADQIREPLPEALMKAIRAMVASPDATPQEKCEAALLIAHGYGLYQAKEGLDPTTYAIPEEQWAEISALLTAGDTALAKVNMALNWMNLGPSGYKP